MTPGPYHVGIMMSSWDTHSGTIRGFRGDEEEGEVVVVVSYEDRRGGPLTLWEGVSQGTRD